MPHDFILAPSLLSADCGNLAEALHLLENIGVPWAHWDVMDGRFVPNITFGQHVIKQLRKTSNIFFDVHLMIEEPERYLDDFKSAGADMLVIHAEAAVHVQRTLARIRELGMKAGIALCPATPLSAVEWVLSDVDMVLLMSVNPGFGGQSFIPSTTDKVRALRSVLDAYTSVHGGPHIDIQIDGGVTVANTSELIAAGADILVSGSGFYSAPNPAARFNEFTAAAAQGMAARLN